MKKKNTGKFVLDFAMAVTFMLLFNKMVFGGLLFHETAGLAIGGAFILHMLLNGKWIKTVTAKLFDRKLPWKTRLGYLLNVLLLLSMAFVIVSGLIVSHVLLPNWNVGNEQWFKMTHISVSFAALLLVGIHVGVHWHWVMNVWKKMIPASKNKWILNVAAKTAVMTLLVYGVYEINETGFLSKAAGITNVVSAESVQGMGERPDFSQAAGEKPDFSQMAAGERLKGMEGREGGMGANPLSVLAAYGSILSVFVIVVYYIGRLWFKKKKTRSKAAPSLT